MDINDVSMFAPLVGTRFQIEIDEDRVVAAELVEADALDTGTANSEFVSRQPFSLLFEVGEGIELPQQTYRVTHDALGELPLFLVPVGPGRMESILN